MEQFPRHRDLGHLEYDVASMAHDLGSNFDEFFPQAGQRPLLDPLRQSQRPQEIAEIVGQRMKRKPHGVGGEMTRAAAFPRLEPGYRSHLQFCDDIAGYDVVEICGFHANLLLWNVRAKFYHAKNKPRDIAGQGISNPRPASMCLPELSYLH